MVVRVYNYSLVPSRIFFTNMIRLGLPTLPTKRNKQDHYLVAILREQQLWSMEKEGHLMQVKREG